MAFGRGIARRPNVCNSSRDSAPLLFAGAGTTKGIVFTATSMLASTYLVRNSDVITQRVKDETVLFDMARGDYYSLNEIGARTWELVDGKRTVSEVAGLLAAEYDAPEEIILEDLQTLVEQLLRDGLLTESKG